MKRLILLIILPFIRYSALAATPDKHVEDIIPQMTLEEKVRMCYGGDSVGKVVFPGVPRLHIPDMIGLDSPRGTSGTPATVFPSGVGMASTWDLPLLEHTGEVLGQECRAKGGALLFGPASNIQRDPLGGRFFEYFSEDPLLSGKLAARMVRGIQSQNIAACIKHLACNGRDFNRNNYMAEVDEQSLHEIYLKNFEITTRESHPWAAMTAANGINGELCSDSRWLLQNTLKEEWGFNGFVMTDFCHSRSTVKAALAGLDVDMPWGTFETTKFGKPLMGAVQAARVPISILNDKVRRILSVTERVGLLNSPAVTGGSLNTPEHQSVARKMAEESMVLLKNDNHFLPLDARRIRKIIVMGPNANRDFCGPGIGGSSGVAAFYEVTALTGLKKRLGSAINVEYMPLTGDTDFHLIDASSFQAPAGKRAGITVRYFNGASVTPITSDIENGLDLKWGPANSPDPVVLAPGSIYIEAEGTIIAPITGYLTLRLSSDSYSTLWFRDRGAPAINNTQAGVPQTGSALVYMEANKPYWLKVIYRQTSASSKNSTEMNYWAEATPNLRLEWSTPSNKLTVEHSLAPVKQRIKAADAVVFVGGLDHNLDCEGRDRSSMDFPPGQEELIRQVATLNPKTAVVLIHGSPLKLQGWLGSVPSVLDAFYPGMEGGTAVAGALFGDVNPSGRLSFTWPKQLEDSPCYAIGTQDKDHIYCKEGVFVGYRYFDSRHVQPLFPFGYGLSYTHFEPSGLRVSSAGDGVHVALKVKNTGGRDGDDVVEVYVHPPQSDPPRPVHELKGFTRLSLAAGETKDVQIVLPPDAFAHWSLDKRGWVVDPGTYSVEIGASSENIQMKAPIKRP